MFQTGGKNKTKVKASGVADNQPESKQDKPVYNRYKPPMPEPIDNNDDVIESEREKLVVYDEVDENKMIGARKKKEISIKHEYKKLPHPRTTLPNPPGIPNRPEMPTAPRGKQIARVQPSFDEAREKQTTKKMFKDLNCQELVDRLKFCGLSEIANMCQTERLNGAFFDNLSDETLRDTMDLKGIQLAKFKQMRDENWVPS